MSEGRGNFGPPILEQGEDEGFGNSYSLRELRFLDRAAHLFAGVKPVRGKPGLAAREAMTVSSPADKDRRLALATCLFFTRVALPSRGWRGAATALHKPVVRAFMRQLREIARPLGAQTAARDAAHDLAVRIVEAAAQRWRELKLYHRSTRHPEQAAASLVYDERLLATETLHELALNVDPAFGRFAVNEVGTAFDDEHLNLVVELLRSFDAVSRGKRGKRSASSILATLFVRIGAFDHSDKRGEERVRKAIDVAIHRYRTPQKGS